MEQYIPPSRRNVTVGDNAPLEAIDWNSIQDDKDLEVWNRVTSNFWLPEKISLSNDAPSWRSLTDQERLTTMRVFTGLTLLDTIQGTVGAISLIPDAVTPHEEAVLTNFAFMESVHAKSYSNIFMTLASTPEINEAFQWSNENAYLQKKAKIIMEYYRGDDPLKKKVASTLLESFLFYSGFYLPFYWSSRSKLTNTADIIRLIVRDECLTADHELLTTRGWKSIADIDGNDMVAQYNSDTGEISFAHPVNISTHVADHTWVFSDDSGRVSVATSPRHRMLFGGSENQVIESEDVNIDDLAGACVIHGGFKSGNFHSMRAVEKLQVMLTAIGNVETDIFDGRVPVRFYGLDDRRVEAIRSLSDEAGWDFDNHDPGKMILHVPVKEYDEAKDFSFVDLEQVDSDWCVDFINQLASWEGSWVRIPSNDAVIGIVSSETVDVVQAIAAFAGYVTEVTEIFGDEFDKQYRMRIYRQSVATSVAEVTKEKGESQQVYGIEVPDGFLLTRRNGAVVITGNSIHGYYIGYKYQQGLQVYPARQEELKEWTYDLLFDLYDNELEYTQDLYDPVGWTPDVKKFLRYNANKALQNLGYDPLFPADETQVSPAILASLSSNSDENHDFFSGSGSSYVIGKAEQTDDDDWDF